MRIIEFRIFVPMKLQMCRAASKYSVNRQTQEHTGGGDGFEIIEAKNYVDNGQPGRYVYRILHCKNKLPSGIRWAVPEKYAHIHEHNRNSFPHYEGDFTIPAMGDSFVLHTQTNHYEYQKGKEIPFNLNGWNEEELKDREIYYLDILDGPASKKKELDLHGYSCPEIGMDELIGSKKRKSDDQKIPRWVNNYEGPMTLIVKTVKFRFKWFGAQTMVEKFVGSTWYQVYLDTHRAMLKWAPNWHNLSDDDLLKLENKTKEQLSEHQFDI